MWRELAALAAALAVAACAFDSSVSAVGDDASQSDQDGATTDAPNGDAANPDPLCGYYYSPEYFDPCVDPMPSVDVNIPGGNYKYDTDSGSFVPSLASGTPKSSVLGGVRVLWAEDFTLSAGSIRVQGSRPLMIVASGTMTIDGTIDVASRFDGITPDVGAGASTDAAACSNPPEPGVKCANHGASGGGGGGFGGEGGQGDHGAAARDCGDGNNGRPPTAGGQAAPLPTKIRAGCAGAPGARTDDGGNQPTDPGRGGPGGGAVHLTARVALNVGGVVHAGGAGGGPALNNRASGGGAGSGGYIALEAPVIVVDSTGVLAANGGGGGGGCENAAATVGENAIADRVAAQGGPGDPNGDPGNDGAFASTPPEAAGTNGDRGGGGGGGGVGYILFYVRGSVSVHTNAIVTPNRTTL